jgi:hypothetical protein
MFGLLLDFNARKEPEFLVLSIKLLSFQSQLPVLLLTACLPPKYSIDNLLFAA